MNFLCRGQFTKPVWPSYTHAYITFFLQIYWAALENPYAEGALKSSRGFVHRYTKISVIFTIDMWGVLCKASRGFLKSLYRE